MSNEKIKNEVQSNVEKYYDNSNKLNILGNVLEDAEVVEWINSRTGEIFNVTLFSLVTNEKGKEPVFNSFVAYGDRGVELENLKKGDYVKIFGEKKQHRTDTGEMQSNIKVLYSKIIKTKEEMDRDRMEMARATVYDNTNKLNIIGNVVKDAEVVVRTNLETGEKFKVTLFSLATNEVGKEPVFNDFVAYGSRGEELKNLKKGDFIKIFGEKKQHRTETGEVHSSIKVLYSKIIKTREEMDRNRADMARATIYDDKNKVNITGNVVKDAEVVVRTNLETGEKFKVTLFSLATNEEGKEPVFNSFVAYGKRGEELKNLKKGDFIKVFGERREYLTEDGQKRSNISVLSAKTLKTKAENEKGLESNKRTDEAVKTETKLEAINRYLKEKIIERIITPER